MQEFITLDGVMQAPGTKEEDPRGGFKYGGWQLPYYDEVLVEFMIERYALSDAILMGRRTYEAFSAYWPTAPDDGNPFVKDMNRLIKYVVSNKPVDLSWRNSFLIKENIVEEIIKLKQQPGNDITVLGSGVLVQMLIQHNLVDEYILMIAPLILGEGTKLFRSEGFNQHLSLLNCTPTKTGVLILTYKNNSK